MRSEYYPLVARVGWWFILPVIVGALYVVAFFGGWFSLPLWFLAAAIGYLFRDPERRIPAKPLGLVSPVDGRIVALRDALDPYLQRPASCILMNTARSGSFTVRSPMEGKLLKQWYAVPGKEKTTSPLLASWIQSDEGDDIVLVVRPRLPWLRIRSHIGPGERVGQGMRFCYVPFGAKIELWVSPGTHIDVRPGQNVRSGSDVVGTLNHGT